MSRNSYNANVMNAKLEGFLDHEFLEIDSTFWPVKEDFTDLWDKLSEDQRLVVSNCISAYTLGDVVRKIGRSPHYITNKLKKERNVGRAILVARICQLPTDTAKAMYLEGFIAAHKSRKYYFEEVQKIIKTDKDHLKELAAQLTVDGDGKRGILKEIVAYGMQVKKVEDPVICNDTGVEIAPMVIALADPRMAFNALQELNRMDHEYGQDDKATSSIESQADRVNRLKDKMNKEVGMQAKRVDVVARSVAKREMKLLNDSSAQGL